MVISYLVGLLIILTCIELTGVTLSLPLIAHSFDLSLIGLSWTNSIYMLVWSVCILPAGFLGDHLAKKRLYLWGVFLFGVGSLISGVSHRYDVFLFGRAFQGVGAAIVLALGMAIAYLSVSNGQKSKSIAITLTAAALGLAVGPALAGWLIEMGGWRWVFIINFPLAIIAVFFLIRMIPKESPNHEAWSFDILSFIFQSILLASVVIGMTLHIHLLYIVTLLACLGLTFSLKRHSFPLIDTKLFRLSGFRFGVVFRFGLNFVMISIMISVMLYWQNILGVSAHTASYMFLPAMIIMALASFYANHLFRYISVDCVCYLAFSIVALCVASLIFLPLSAPLWLHSIVASLYGLGAGLGMNAATLTALSEVPSKKTGRGMGIYFSVTIIANLLANALSAVILQDHSLAKLHDIYPSITPATTKNIVDIFSGAKSISILPDDLYHLAVTAFQYGYHSLLLIAFLVLLITSVGAFYLKSTQSIKKA